MVVPGDRTELYPWGLRGQRLDLEGRDWTLGFSWTPKSPLASSEPFLGAQLVTVLGSLQTPSAVEFFAPHTSDYKVHAPTTLAFLPLRLTTEALQVWTCFLECFCHLLYSFILIIWLQLFREALLDLPGEIRCPYPVLPKCQVFLLFSIYDHINFTFTVKFVVWCLFPIKPGPMFLLPTPGPSM